MRHAVVVPESTRPAPTGPRTTRVEVRCYFTGRKQGEKCNAYNIAVHYVGVGPDITTAKAKATKLAREDGWDITSIRHVVPA